ncbi:MAG TPA: metallophosphoesterase family protein [Bacteroidales bacterium]|nr:metallophosphoesterase family protein [Bacteroidales bacterium]HSA43267.1 metallophosphoesterase family protein [Bacteroidales bacterium]
MIRIGLLSDTHGSLHPRVFPFFSSCDEIWHAGDIGSESLAAELAAYKTFRAVYGNIDGNSIRLSYPEVLLFTVESMKVLITHQGGYPSHYSGILKRLISLHSPDLLITGHSHILKVIYDQQYSLLYINPGAAGNSGWHRVITYLRFVIDGKVVKDLEIAELPRGYGRKRSI